MASVKRAAGSRNRTSAVARDAGAILVLVVTKGVYPCAVLGEDFRSLVVCGMTSEAGGYTGVVGVFGMRWFLLAGGGIMGGGRWRGKVRRGKVLRRWGAPPDPGPCRAAHPSGTRARGVSACAW